MTQLISFEKFTNIQNAQAGLTRLFAKAEKSASFCRVLKNDKPLGVLLPEKIWMSFVEDLEALSSPMSFLNSCQLRGQRFIGNLEDNRLFVVQSSRIDYRHNILLLLRVAFYLRQMVEIVFEEIVEIVADSFDLAA